MKTMFGRRGCVAACSAGPGTRHASAIARRQATRTNRVTLLAEVAVSMPKPFFGCRDKDTRQDASDAEPRRAHGSGALLRLSMHAFPRLDRAWPDPEQGMAFRPRL